MVRKIIRPSVKRRWQRLPLAFPILVRGKDAAGRPFVEFGSAVNISAGGALIGLNRFIPSGATVTLEIPCSVVSSTSATAGKKQLAARAVRVDALDEKHLLGLEFHKPLIQPAGSSARKKKKSKAAASL
jgi:hypothetical protein